MKIKSFDTFNYCYATSLLSPNNGKSPDLTFVKPPNFDEVVTAAGYHPLLIRGGTPVTATNTDLPIVLVRSLSQNDQVKKIFISLAKNCGWGLTFIPEGPRGWGSLKENFRGEGGNLIAPLGSFIVKTA